MLRELVNRNIVKVEPGTDLEAVCRLMRDENVGSVFVVDGKKVVGIITDRDIVVRYLAEGQSISEVFVDDLMSEAPVSCRETDGVYECIQKMREAKIRRIPVLNEKDEIVGVLSFGDLLSMLSREFSELVHTTTRDEEYRAKERKIA